METSSATGDSRDARLIRLQARREQEAAESAAGDREASAQALTTVLMGLGSQGIEISAEMPDRDLRGRISHVGAEMVSVETVGGDRFDIVLARVNGFRSTPGAPRPGSVSTGHPHTILARLREAAGTGEVLSVSRVHGAPFTGLIQGVNEAYVQGLDHNGTYWLVPLPMVTWVTRV